MYMCELSHSSVGLWPGWLLTAAPTRFSTENVKRWNKWDVSFHKNSFGLLCMHTLPRKTLYSHRLRQAERHGCGQNLFSPFPFFLLLLQVKELLWSSSKLQLLASSATTHHKKSNFTYFTYFHAKRWHSCRFQTVFLDSTRVALHELQFNISLIAYTVPWPQFIFMKQDAVPPFPDPYEGFLLICSFLHTEHWTLPHIKMTSDDLPPLYINKDEVWWPLE